MLHPSDPSSSSSKVSAPRSDERISEQDPVVVSFGDAHTPSFSIRNYAFESRSKNSGTSWPFPPWLLEFFLKHGVQDLLPPFEPSSSVRHLCRRSSEPEAEKIRIINSPQVEEFLTPTVSCLASDDKFVSFLEKDEGQCSSDPDEKPENLVNDCENFSAETVHCDTEKFSPDFGEPVVKKRRLVLSETSRTEETTSTPIASDPMASKVCPVCKTFSSTSNTTLNAHMDQCLSVASDAALTVDELPKHKVKPRKKRLMEDIYATATRCSLEDLDRRNGTNWATSLQLASAPIEANSEAKEFNLSQVDARDERSEGAVYVDSNGIKLRILSKFNDASQLLPSDALFRSRKSLKHLRDGKIISVSSKKTNFREKHTRKLKLKMENKKLRSLKLFKNEAAPEAVQHDEARLEESPIQLLGELNQAQVSSETGTLQRWPSSKRSNLPKKICKKDFTRSLEHSEIVTQMKNLDTRKSSSGIYSSGRRHIKLTQLPESKTVDFTPTSLKRMENKDKSSEGCLSKGTPINSNWCKLSRASEALLSSPRSGSDEFYVGRKDKLHDPPLKTIKISSLTRSNLSSKKIGKHRSVHTGKRKTCFFFNNGEQGRYAEASITSFQDEHITDKCLNSKLSFGKGDDRSIKTKSLYGEGTAKSLNGEGTDLLLASDDKLSTAMPTEECGMMIKQLLLDERDEMAHDKLENRGVESEAGAVSTESSACLTSHGDLELDIQRENCSIASALVFPNQDSNSALIRELSGSPTSNSFIFNTSLKGSHPKASQGELGQFIDRSQHFRMDSIMNKPQQQSDYHRCCCSYQRIMSGTMPTSKPKIFPNLYIKPSISSTFGAYSSLQTEMGTATSVRSPTGSMVARDSNSIIGSTSPSCGTPSQSSSNSILRLMGKDLMISHNEETSNLPKFDSLAKDNNSTVQSFPSPLSFPDHASFTFAVRSPATPMTNMQACIPSPCVHQSNTNHKVYLKNMINGSSDDDRMIRGTSFPIPASHTMFQRVSPYLPSENGYVNNEVSSLQVPAPLMQRPFVFRSPSVAHLNAPFYYPQSLR